jgi:protein ImuB
MHFACIRLLSLALDLCESTPTAFVVLHGSSNRPLVHQANAPACRQGVRAGLSLSAAQALVPELHYRWRNLQSEQDALKQLAHWAYRYSDQLAIENQALLVEIGGSLRLYGRELLKRWRQELRAMGFQSCFGIGRTPAQARAAATTGQDQRFHECRAHLLLTQTELAVDACDALAACGVRTLSELLALPRAEVAERFGPEVYRVLDCLLGIRSEPMQWFKPAANFQARLELPAPIHQGSMLLFALKRLLGWLIHSLQAHDASVQELVLTLELEAPQPAQHLSLKLASPSRDLEHLLMLWRSRVDALVLAAPVLAIALSAPQFFAYQACSADLFDRSLNAAAELPRLYERLVARLGTDAVHVMEARADFRPECYSPNRQLPLSDRKAITVDRAARLHALWLYPTPQPIEPSAYRLESGPERIESGWWDDADVRRDYFQALGRDGVRYWLFEDLRSGLWFCHGVLA